MRSRECRAMGQHGAMAGKHRYLSVVAVVGLSTVPLGLSGCSGSRTPDSLVLDSFIAKYEAVPAACAGALYDREVGDAEFECWRVEGIDDIEVFTQELALAVNGGTAPVPEHSFCPIVGLIAPETARSCVIEFRIDDQRIVVGVERDLYSTELESLKATGEFPDDTVSTIIIARSTSTPSPEG